MSVQKHYPMQGSKRFETTSMPIVRSFRVDCGAQTATTTSTQIFRKGDMILGFQAKVTEAVTSADANSITLGFTGNRMLSASTTKTSLVVNYVLGPNQTNGSEACPYVLTADDYFDVTETATATGTAGKFDVHVLYVPAPDGVCNSTFKEYVTT